METLFEKIRLVCGYKELFEKLCSLSEELYPLAFCVCFYVVLDLKI